jgi:hypothetical protein
VLEKGGRERERERERERDAWNIRVLDKVFYFVRIDLFT